MITEGGQGGQHAAPITREIYDGIFGLDGHKRLSGLGPDGSLPTTLPVVRADGTIAPPGHPGAAVPHAGRSAPASVVRLAARPAGTSAASGGCRLPLVRRHAVGAVRGAGRRPAMTDWSTPRVSPVPLRPREASLRERALDRDSPLRRLDWVLLLAVAALVSVGSLLVWSATRGATRSPRLDPQAFLKKHLINAVIGLALAAIAALVDYRSLRAYAPFVYVASCLGLLAVLSPLGSTINGAHSWIVLPAGFQVQPSEFAKVAIVVGMAMLLSETRDGEDAPRDIDVLLALSFCALPMGLIMLQPDLGTTMS